MHFSCTGFLIGAFFFFPVRTGAAASVRQQRPQQAAAQGAEKSAARRVPPVTPGPRRSTRQLRRAGRQAECERGGSPAPAGGA